MPRLVNFLNFTSEEVSCPCGCGESTISMELMQRVQMIRTILDRPLIVTSGVRCEEYNKKVGGEEDSEHVPLPNLKLPGEGIDIRCVDSVARRKIVFLATVLGLRIGVGPGFIHLGIRQSKPMEVLWDYY